MCSNFEPASIKQIEVIVDKQLQLNLQDYKQRVYPHDHCPIIIPFEDSYKVVNGQFGLSPFWASEPVNYSTYNARLETIENKKTFEPAFKKNQFCIVPMQSFYEPYYIESKNKWQRIYRQDNQPFLIAGMFEFNSHFGEPIHSFTLLTHNADDETFMSKFHRPDKEKRSISRIVPDLMKKYLEADHSMINDYMSIISGEQFAHKDA